MLLLLQSIEVLGDDACHSVLEYFIKMKIFYSSGYCYVLLFIKPGRHFMKNITFHIEQCCAAVLLKCVKKK